LQVLPTTNKISGGAKVVPDLNYFFSKTLIKRAKVKIYRRDFCLPSFISELFKAKEKDEKCEIFVIFMHD